MEDADRMFDKASFRGLNSASEAKSAVHYLAHNEIKFRQELATEGLSYEETQKEVAAIWKSVLAACDKYKYSDYITISKKQIYKV